MVHIHLVLDCGRLGGDVERDVGGRLAVVQAVMEERRRAVVAVAHRLERDPAEDPDVVDRHRVAHDVAIRDVRELHAGPLKEFNVEG